MYQKVCIFCFVHLTKERTFLSKFFVEIRSLSIKDIFHIVFDCLNIFNYVKIRVRHIRNCARIGHFPLSPEKSMTSQIKCLTQKQCLPRKLCFPQKMCLLPKNVSPPKKVSLPKIESSAKNVFSPKNLSLPKIVSSPEKVSTPKIVSLPKNVSPQKNMSPPKKVQGKVTYAGALKLCLFTAITLST